MAEPSKISTLDSLKNRWFKWSQASNNRRIFSAACIVGGLSVGVKVIALLRELVIASSYGTGDAIEAFLVAFMVPMYVVNFLVEPIKTSFTPTYIQVRNEEGKKSSEVLISGVFFICLIILISATVLLYLCGPFLIPMVASGFSQEKIALTLHLYNCLIPLLLINGSIALFSSLLNSDENFALAALAPATVPVITILALFFLNPVWGVYSLALGYILGFAIQAGILYASLKKKGFVLRPCWTGITPAIRQKFNQYSYIVVSAFLNYGKEFVNRAMAATLIAGSVASLAYANRVIELVMGIAISALATAILPYFSKMAADKDWSGISHTLKTYSLMILGVTLPFTVLFFVGAEQFITFLFQRGEFKQEDSILIGQVLAILALQIPFKIINVVGQSLLVAHKKNRALVTIATASLAGNIIFNLIFIKQMGLRGIALGTSTAIFFTSILIYFYLYTKVLKNHPE